ncbi:MAG TPA: ATP-dependent zinc metalloprotease FtsH [Clostridiales bacterium]|nr:ATP-dependent zinc metalloprotease FtsH [Clostridiales bacterium]
MNKKYLFFMLAFVLIIVFLVGKNSLNKTENMTYPTFLQAVENKQVDEVRIDDDSNTFIVKLKGDETKPLYTVSNPKTEDFVEKLLINGVDVSYGQVDLIAAFIKIALVGLIVWGIIYYTRNGNKNNIEDANKKGINESAISLSQVAGNSEAKYMVNDIIGFIKSPDKYTAVGARMPKGLLFYGPPGTGKTLMAKAIAGEAGVPFYAMSGSDFVQMYVGVGASRIRNLFNKAKKNEKAVIFIDEIDAIGKRRSKNTSASNDERDQTLNALLTEMSGFHDNQGIVVIGATNRLDTLDEALLRPGRFDRQIEIGLPDVNSRHKILSLHAKSKPLSDDVDLYELAKSTVLFSGAMLENLLNEAAIIAANANKVAIQREHIDKAFYTVIAGAPKIDRSYISERDRKITAYHEAGHALVTKLLLPEHYISKVTIIPSVKGAGGFNLSIPKDTLFQSQKQLKANIQVLLAGRVAEELIFGESEITTGASNDIQKASSLILDYINKFGMDSELGLFSIEVLGDNQDSQLINRCRNMMNDLYGETKNIVTLNLDQLRKITDELLIKESLNDDDIQQCLSKCA